MKKALLVVAAVALVVWVASWFRNENAVAVSASEAWPGGMGTLDSVLRRFPPRKANDAADKLQKLAAALPKNDAVNAFVGHEIARGELAIGAPPKLPDITAIRELLLREPMIWARGGGVGDANETATRAAQMMMARALVANALAKARADDATAWDDLRPVWNLARSLDDQPQMMSQTASLTMSRMINAIAWKMPLPPPPWLDEWQQRDYVPRLLTAFQYQAASYWRGGAQIFPTKWLANSIENDRRIAQKLLNVSSCDVGAPSNELGVDLTSVWRRAFRYRAEREATANALRIRNGQTIETASACSGGTWSFDGTTLRFSRDIPSSTGDNPMPLVLRLVSREKAPAAPRTTQ